MICVSCYVGNIRRPSLQALSRAPSENGRSHSLGSAKCRWPQPMAVARWFPNAEALQLWGERWCRRLTADGEPFAAVVVDDS